MSSTNELQVYNTDQMPVNLETHGHRTLAYKGQKVVEMTVQRRNPTTHSFTVQLVINAEGDIQLPALVCLYEPTPPKSNIIEKEAAPFRRLKVVHSRSGLMNGHLVEQWLDEVFLPSVTTVPDQSVKPLLMRDAWGGYDKPLARAAVREKVKIILVDSNK